MSKTIAQDPSLAFAQALRDAQLLHAVTVTVDVVGNRVLATLMGLAGRALRHAKRVINSTARKLGIQTVNFTYAAAA